RSRGALGLPGPTGRLRAVGAGPGEAFRLAFVGDAGPDEGVDAGLGQLQRVPLALLADRPHRLLLAVQGLQVDDPRPGAPRTHASPRPVTASAADLTASAADLTAAATDLTAAAAACVACPTTPWGCSAGFFRRRLA